jgi:alpha-tubulin suppressor-like RCC1 family protein
VQIIASNVVAVAAGGYSSYFIKSDGSLWAMGYNLYGQLGDGTVTSRRTPVQIVPPMTPQPVITGVSLVSQNLIISGTNGESEGTYYTLRSTNLAAPLNQWTPIATNTLPSSLPANGAFTITNANAVVADAAQGFYVLQAQ